VLTESLEIDIANRPITFYKPLLIPPGKLDSFRLAIRELIGSVNTTAFSFCSG